MRDINKPKFTHLAFDAVSNARPSYDSSTKFLRISVNSFTLIMLCVGNLPNV